MKKEGSCIRSAGEFLAREPRIRDDREGKREVNNELRLTPFLEPNSPPSKRPRADVIGRLQNGTATCSECFVN